MASVIFQKRKFLAMNKASYIPRKLPPQEIDWKKLIPLIGKAHAAIARYDGLLQSLINPAVLLSPLTTTEAVLSSKIEGTQASLEEVFELEAGFRKERPESIKQDIHEIINYRISLLTAEKGLEQRDITLNFVKGIHKILLSSVRGRNRNPGEFRKDQNWIGRPGTAIEEARFIPPNPIIVQEFMEDWEVFLLSNNFEDKLVQLAILHAQFEIIHPFKDGNGRIGRLLIPLFLYAKKLLSRPMFYLSEYLEARRQEYYDKLLFVSEKDDWQAWIEFFLMAIIQQSNSNTKKAEKILELYEELKQKFLDSTHSQYAVPLLDVFFQKPIVNSSTALKLANIGNRVTGNVLLRKLEENKLIVILSTGKGRNPNVYALPKLINITEGKGVF